MADNAGLTQVSTIYFGGGTPSLLLPEEIKQLIQEVHNHWPVAPDAEVTLEANPDDLTEPYSAALLSSGVNRLSIGIQSFFAHHLAYMNRAHSAEQASESIRIAQRAGFHNITADLIYGFPSLTMEEWQGNLERMLGSGIQHISAYCLTIESGTFFGHQKKKGLMDLPLDGCIREQYALLTQTLCDAGFEHYEVSNFGKPGYKSRHNGAYWSGAHYLGIGPGAHSYNGTERRWNARNNPIYLQKVPQGKEFYESETLTPRDRINEYILLSLRTRAGLSMHELLHLGWRADDKADAFISDWVQKGWMNKSQNGLSLTEEGFLMADYIASELFVV